MQKMLSTMSKMYPMFLMMGLGVVIASFIIGLVNQDNASEYFSASKEVRETTAAFIDLRVDIESVGHWMPKLKFLGIGLILSGIIMALRVIIDRLREVGDEVLANLAEKDRPALPTPPWYGLLMPLMMMMGLAIFIIALIISLDVASDARDVFANALPAIDSAGAGSDILNSLRSIAVREAWLVPFKFFGIAVMFLAIIQGLATIIYILNAQTSIIDHSIVTGRKSGVVERS